GKSTLMNVLSKSDVFAENKLFATLDTTVRKIVIANLPLLLTDTVGFIRKLPTQLIESFKSTLDEVREADLVLHVVDISHPSFIDHINAVNGILSDIGASDKATIMVFNKIDAYNYVPKDEDDLSEAMPENVSLDELERTWMSKTGDNTVFISAKTKLNVEQLRHKIYDIAAAIHMQRFPYNDFLFEYYDDDANTAEK
ncbi:MAG: 50S ribosome-binding GTPase, partial [Flavobacteriales bacterium]|nr:50S ribosome-binding GTPase [Flavobacteriales bacterium]